MKHQSTARAHSHAFRAFGLVLALSAGALPPAVNAASPSIWNGGGADDLWSNAANWGGNAPVPGTSYDLQFGGSARLTPQNDFNAGSAFRHFTFNGDAGAFVLGGNSITLSGHITNNSANLQTFNMPLTTSAGRFVATASGDVTFAGPISGNGGLNLVGPGTVTLAARNTYTNYTYVNGGTLVLPPGGSINSAFYVFIGQNAGQNGSLIIKGGTLTNTMATGTGNFMVGRAGFGALDLSAGTVKVNQVYIGWDGGTGAALINGGSFYCGTASDYVVIGNGGSGVGGTGVLTVKAGLFSHANANRVLSLNNNGVGRAEVNVLGGVLDNTGGAIGFGYNTALAAMGRGSSVVNVNGGTLILNRFVNQSQNQTPVGDAGFSSINFNGGTLKATAQLVTSQPTLAFSSNFIPANIELRVNGAFGDFAGGAVFDTAGQDCTVEPPLLATAGQGITSLNLADGGSGYTGAPYVYISGEGSNATAVANMVDDGTGKGTFKVGSITVCNPGVNYNELTTSFTLVGGAPASQASLAAVPVTTAVIASGGLTKNGAGTLTLKGANTYSGDTIVNAGKLLLSPAHSGSGKVIVNDGAAFGVERDATTSALAVPSVTVGNSTGGELDFVITGANPTSPSMTVGTLTLNGTTTVAVSGADLAVGPQFPLIKYTTLIGNPASITNGILIAPDGAIAKLVHNPANSSFDLLITTVVRQLKWAGTVNTGGLGVWDSLVTPNWLSGGASAVFIPGADAIFDDTAAGVTSVSLVGSLDPGSVTFNNTSKSYTLSGAGALVGSMNVVKNGSGTATLNNTNIYTGSTVVSNGTLVIGGLLSNTTGAVSVEGGSLVISGSVNTGTGAWRAGETGSGTIKLTPGAVVQLNGSFIAGNTATGAGAVQITGGALTNSQASTSANFEIGYAGYGALNMSGGDLKMNTFYIGGSSGIGVVSLSGGNVFVGQPGTADYLLVGGVSAGTGVLTVSGGVLNHANVNRLISVNNNSDGRGELNLLGGLIDNSGGAVGYGYNAGTGTGTGIVNINGGNLILNRFVNTKQGGTLLTGNAYLNLNGGTLTASASTLGSPSLSFSRSFIPARMEVRINGPFGTFAGGATVDTVGQDCLVESPLLAPTGDGIRSLGVLDGGTGYIGAPYVSIVGDGFGASAVANMVDDGTGKGTFKVGSITVCNPGVGYTASGTFFTLTGGAPAVPASSGNVTTAPNTSGGLVKNGAGALTLAATNTYTGATVVNAGSLIVDGMLSVGSSVSATGGALGGNGTVAGQVSIQSGGTLSPGSGIGTLTINNSLTLAAGSTTLMEIDASAATNDTVQGITAANYGGTLVVSNVAGTLTAGQTFQLFSAANRSGDFATVRSYLGAGLQGQFNPANGTLTIIVGGPDTTPTNIVTSWNGSTLTLSWPESHRGWYAQSNAVDVTKPEAWFDIPGSESANSLTITADPSRTNVFYRLRLP